MERRSRFDAQGPGDIDELDHINSTLAAFYAGDERIGGSQALRQLTLRQAGFGPQVRQ